MSEKTDPTEPGNSETVDRLTREEIVLYVLTLLILVGISIYFWHIFHATRDPGASAYISQDIEGLKLSEERIPEADRLKYEWLKAQLQVVSKRYELASRLNLTYSYIKYIAFVVGTVLCLLGTIVIFKGVRPSPIESEMNTSDKIRFKISTSSPGAFMTFMGTVIIVVSITFRGESVKIEDEGITIGEYRRATGKVIRKTDISALTPEQQQKLLVMSEEDRNKILQLPQQEMMKVLDTIQ